MDSAYKCAYAVDAATDTDGPQCASHGNDFCFLCSFEPEPSVADSKNDLYTSMVDLIEDLNDADKEIALIVDVIAAEYRQTVRPHITWTNPATGVVVESPDWKKVSIRRHLITSKRFGAKVFPSIVRGIFVSIICKQNESMVDRETNMVVEDSRRAFIDTVDAYRKFTTWDTSTKRPKTA